MRKAALAALLVLPLTACAPDLTPPPLPEPPRIGPPPPPPPPGSGDFAAGKFARPLSVADAEQILLRTEIFAYGGMNNFPHPEAFDLLLQQADALQIAHRLARAARPAGRLFALCMLKHLEERSKGRSPGPQPYEVEALAVELAQTEGRVEHIEADVVHMPTMPEIVVQILNRRLWRYLGTMGGPAVGSTE
jgi:hypothetical protein